MPIFYSDCIVAIKILGGMGVSNIAGRYGVALSCEQEKLMEDLKSKIHMSRPSVHPIIVGIFKDTWYYEFGEEVTLDISKMIEDMCRKASSL